MFVFCDYRYMSCLCGRYCCYSIVKPVEPILIATLKYASNSAAESYSGKSSLLKQVCARGYIESYKDTEATKRRHRSQYTIRMNDRRK